MVRGAERGVIVEVHDVVVAAGVFEGDGFVGVDVPHLGVVKRAGGNLIGQHVVEGAKQAGELVGRVSLVLFGRDGEAIVAEDIERGLVGVGIEITQGE